MRPKKAEKGRKQPENEAKVGAKQAQTGSELETK